MKTFQNQWLCTYILSFLASFLQKWPQCTVKSAKISFIVQQPLRETLVCLCRNRKFSKGHKYLPLWALAKLVWASRIADDVANFFLEPSLDQEVYRQQVYFYLLMPTWTFPSNELSWTSEIYENLNCRSKYIFQQLPTTNLATQDLVI